MSSAKKITLKSSDGEAFEVEEAVALESQTIKHMIEDDCADSGIPLPNVTSKILAKVIEYCKKHVEAANPEDKPSEDDLKAWDAEFVKVDQATLFDLILVCSLFDSTLLLLLCHYTCISVSWFLLKYKEKAFYYIFFSFKILFLLLLRVDSC